MAAKVFLKLIKKEEAHNIFFTIDCITWEQ